MVKRLLCIVSSMDTGGAETFLMKIYRGLDKTKYQMDFVVSADGFYDNEILSLGGRIHKIPLRTKEPLTVYKQIKNIVKQNKYEVVLKLGNSPLCVLDLIAAKMGGAKICAMRSCNALTNLSFKQKLLDLVFRPILNLVASVKLAPSDLAAIYTFGEKKFQNDEVNILHNGVDLGVFHYDADARTKIREEFSLDDSLVVGHVGRFSKQKNHKFLLPVFADIKKKNNNAKLLLVGTGELESQIRTQAKELGISDDLVFAGVRSDVPALLSAMDVFVLTSLYEGMPNTIIEAQATGLPCIISDTITRQANITGLVSYLPLNQDVEVWADKALLASAQLRKDTTDDFLEGGRFAARAGRKFECAVVSIYFIVDDY